VLADNDPTLHVLDNSGALEHTVEHMLACIDGQAACA
jgi:ribose 1,5-bisphosphokinase